MAEETNHSDGPERQPVPRLLIVEDDASQLQTLSAIMQTRGFEVDPCRTASEAMAHFKRDGADVVLLDLHLPDASGMEVLRKLADGSDVPVILHTAFSSFESARDAVNLGAFAYVEKGGDPNELVHHVHKALEARLHRRAEDLEDAVAERTRELQQANESLKREFEERKRAERALRERTERLSEAERLGRLGFLDWDLKTNEMYWSDGVYDLCGIDPATTKATVDLTMQLIHPDDLKFVQENLDSALAGVKRYDIDHRKLRPDGGVVWIHAQADLVRDEHGNPERLFGTVSDITDRVRAEETLQKERDFAEGLIATAQAIVLVLDTEGRIVRFNPYMETVSGYRLDEVRGKDWISTFLPQRDHKRIRKLFRRAVDDIPTHGNVNVIVTREGQERRIEWYDKTLKDNMGNIVGLLAVGQDITERKRAEEAAAAAGRLSEQVLRSSPAVIYGCRIDPGCGPEGPHPGVFVSENIERILGFKPEECLSDAGWWAAHVHPDDVAGAFANMTRLFDEGRLTHEYRIRHKDGSYRWIRDDLALTTDAAGKPTKFTGSWTDVSQRRKAEDKLRESEQRFRRLFERSPMAYQSLDENGYIIEANPAWLELLGYSREEVIGQWFGNFLVPESATDFRRNFPCFKEAGETHGVEFQMMRKDGTSRAIMFNGRIGYDADGNFLQTHCILHDITKQRLKEQRIADLARFPSENPYPVLRIRSDGIILHANPAAARLLADHELSTDGQAPDDWQRSMAMSMESGSVVRKEFHYDHETFAFHFSPLADAGYVNVYGVDITEQKDLEAQLRQAQKMEAIGRLAGGIAHDFRNQLTVITGYADWMLSHMDDDNQYAQYMRQILDAAQRSTRLTGHLLAFSRREILEPQIVGPMALIDSLVEPLKHMIGEDVILVTSGGDDLDNITIDPSQFEHMLVNLAVNARDAMPNGGDLRIDVMSTELDSKHARRNIDARPGKYVTITVADTGIGMDAETCRNAFDPFFTTKPVGEGTGLGLSMVYGFVRQSGGYITLRSKVGHGTTFKIYLPATTEQTQETESQDDADDTTGDRATATILAVEDDEQLRGMLADILRKGRHTVLTAGNAREALPIGEHYEGQIDLLITDVVMPGMSGVELAEKLKAVRPDMPVLLVSGYGDSELLRRGLSADNIELLLKPFGADELLDAVNRMLT